MVSCHSIADETTQIRRPAGAHSAKTWSDAGEDRLRFVNRTHAGRRLARLLDHLRNQPVVVLGLPRGGVPVGFQVARRLSAPLEVLLVRKLGASFQPELAMGAIGEGEIRIIDQERVRQLGIKPDQIDRVERQERKELDRQGKVFRQGRRPIDLMGRTAIIVDDGVATGSTALAACSIARRLGADRIVMATPVAPREVVPTFEQAVDQFVAVTTPQRMGAIGFFYADFRPTPDSEVIDLLECSRRTDPGPD